MKTLLKYLVFCAIVYFVAKFAFYVGHQFAYYDLADCRFELPNGASARDLAHCMYEKREAYK